MKWLLNNRTDFTDNGWAGLLGKDAMKFASMDGNHFTMMRDEHVSFIIRSISNESLLTYLFQSATLGKLIKQGLDA